MLEREEWMAHVVSILRARDMHERPGRERDIRDRGTIRLELVEGRAIMPESLI